MDLLLFSLCLLANLFGLFLIYSATRYTPTLQTAFPKQVAASLVGILAYILSSTLDVKTIVHRFRAVLFAAGFLLLLLLIPFGNAGNSGNKNWIEVPLIPFNIQPAEVVKLLLVLLLALRFSQKEESGNHRLSHAILTFLYPLSLSITVFLVSSDLGMVLLYLFVFFIMAWVSGFRLRWFALSFLAMGILSFFLWPILPSYVQMRFLVVFDHNLDPQGKGFQQLRSLLAIGSGQLSGQGYLAGTQTQNMSSSSLPARHTDFIFSVAGGELGLLGSVLILLLLAFLVFRCALISFHCQDTFYSYVAAGFSGMLAVQILFNIGMCLFLAPVVGVTLPFFSYGGSSLITLYIAMGILSHIKAQQNSASEHSKQASLIKFSNNNV